MLCKVYTSHEAMIMVIEECLPCFFKSLCSYVFHVYSIFLWVKRCWYYALHFLKEETWGMLVCEVKNFMWLWSCFMSLSHVMLRKWKNKWRLGVRVLLENGKWGGLWGIIGGKHGVHGTFLLVSQPLDEFLYCFWIMRSWNPLFGSC